MLRTAVFAFALPLLGSARLLAQAGPGATAAAPEVVATGYAEATARPDRARLVLAVVTRAASAAEAGRLNGARIAPVLAALRRLGLADSAVTTDGYTGDADDEDAATPPSARRPRRVYVARNAVRVTLRHLDRLGTGGGHEP